MKECDKKLYSMIRKNSRKMPHDDLYYALLDWADQHPEIQDELARENDCYIVKYVDKISGDGMERKFTTENYQNPYRSAMDFYNTIIGLADVAELWMKGNPFLPGQYRYSHLIKSYEHKGED